MTNVIEFPNLFSDELKISRTVFSVFGFEIYWYGLIITIGVVIGVLAALKNAKQAGVLPECVLDTAFFGIIGGIVGARAYYVIFHNLNPNNYIKYTLWTAITGIRDGGLAIYGGIIGAVLLAFISVRIRKLKFLPLIDLAALALPIGQAIGRWGNFVNQEAYGAPTAGNLPWGMTGNLISNSQEVILATIKNMNSGITAPVLVHPCFLYESLWCALGAALLWLYYRKFRVFDGETALMYVMWYGAGRAFIESLRADSLYIGDFRVSQLLAVCSALIAALIYIALKVKGRHGLYRDTFESKAAAEKMAAVAALNAEEKDDN